MTIMSSLRTPVDRDRHGAGEPALGAMSRPSHFWLAHSSGPQLPSALGDGMAVGTV